MSSVWSCVCFFCSRDVNPQNIPLVTILSTNFHVLDWLWKDSNYNFFVPLQNFWIYLFLYFKNPPIFFYNSLCFLICLLIYCFDGSMRYALFSSYAKWSLEEVYSLYTSKIKTWVIYSLHNKNTHSHNNWPSLILLLPLGRPKLLHPLIFTSWVQCL